MFLLKLENNLFLLAESMTVADQRTFSQARRKGRENDSQNCDVFRCAHRHQD